MLECLPQRRKPQTSSGDQDHVDVLWSRAVRGERRTGGVERAGDHPFRCALEELRIEVEIDHLLVLLRSNGQGDLEICIAFERDLLLRRLDDVSYAAKEARILRE